MARFVNLGPAVLYGTHVLPARIQAILSLIRRGFNPNHPPTHPRERVRLTFDPETIGSFLSLLLSFFFFFFLFFPFFIVIISWKKKIYRIDFVEEGRQLDLESYCFNFSCEICRRLLLFSVVSRHVLVLFMIRNAFCHRRAATLDSRHVEEGLFFQ